MEFYRKIDALLTLTSTTNAKLANAINIDRSQISRMRTGARERPKKNDILKLMAKYFAKHCLDEYRISALEKLTYDYRIRVDTSEDVLAAVLFEWLCTDEDIQQPIVYHIGQFSTKNTELQLESKEESQHWFPENQDFVVYYGNAGKRQATKDFFNMLVSASSTQKLLVSSDERNEWFFENHNFTQMISKDFYACVKKGISCTQICTLSQDLDIALYTVRQWISGYMLGNLRQYYYPMHRDKLYRRTLMVIPGVAALYSSSLSNQTESYMTILTTVQDAVESYSKEFYDLLAFCKPMTTIYTSETADKLLSSTKRIQEELGESIFKFSSLPTHTFPLSIIEQICKPINSSLANKVYENYLNGAKARAKSLQNYRSVDIIKLVPIEQVRAGKVEISDSGFFSNSPYYYTPGLYKEHLQYVVDELEQYRNYEVIISESSDLDSLVLFGIGANTAIIVKQNDPCAVIEINEPNFACSFTEFLQHFAEKERKNKSKQETISILKKYISQI